MNATSYLLAIAVLIVAIPAKAAVTLVDTVPDGVDLTFFSGVFSPIDINGDGLDDYIVGARTGSSTLAFVAPAEATGNRIIGFGQQILGLSSRPLPVGSLIDATPNIVGDDRGFTRWSSDVIGAQILSCGSPPSGCNTSYFAFEETGFVGVEFLADDGYHYGWIEIQPSSVIRIHRWAYQSPRHPHPSRPDPRTLHPPPSSFSSPPPSP
ncbi:MAG: hypothetical protein P8J87_11565 [Verrucomicrobiales bacterium]|nr:hypothetical protein [Verrucomicrobiales bacterium]